MQDGEKVKAWIRSNGPSLFAGLVLGVGILLGFQWWSGYKQERAAAASALFTQMLTQEQQGAGELARGTADRLMQEYARTPYAGKAALVAARVAFEAKEVSAAQSYLQWAMTQGREEATRHSARLRLARILLDQGKIDEALQLVHVERYDGFRAEYEELRGDLLARQGKLAEARAAYTAALERLRAGSPYARVLQMKLDDLGAEQPS